ncbi:MULTISPECIES: PEP-CTERM sorting domain-containing protein [Moorena]|uniref:PEP-CTERM sorting domain-containing protein n=1 Tax=Moorena TaxID=1155738 RepID=UPI00142C7A7F|nr:PEP-CTERM sorting domain-containing protein [Moorena sp. SIO4G3]NEO78464.1 PEP-CTERM sorting domain-containing protein [Moorena sp. SIO4G3]
MKTLLATAIGTVLLTSTAQAATFVDTREALNPNDFLDWSEVAEVVVAPPFPTLPNPFSATSAVGLDLNVSIPAGEFLRIDQTPVFPGAFDVGDALLFTGLANPGPLTITFDTPVFGVGTQIQSAPIEIVDYIATIEAFDSFGNSLGSFERPGVSQMVAGSGVIFTGVFDSSGDIKTLVLNAKEEGVDVRFAINALSITSVPINVPEPSVILGLLVIGTGSIVSRLRGLPENN